MLTLSGVRFKVGHNIVQGPSFMSEPSQPRPSLYTPEQRWRRDHSMWTLVQGILAPLQFLVFLVSLVLVGRTLLWGLDPEWALWSVVAKTGVLYLIMVTGSIWEKKVFGQYLFAASFFWEDVVSMGVMVLALTGAGILQVWLQRIPTENAMSFMATQEQLTFFYWTRIAGGVIFLLGQLLYFSSFFIGGEPVRSGRVLAAEFTNQGNTYRAVWFEYALEQGGYYTFDGRSLRKQFLRSPLEFSRISSGYSSARFHPLLREWRAHKGIDYAAPAGTRRLVRLAGPSVTQAVEKALDTRTRLTLDTNPDGSLTALVLSNPPVAGGPTVRARTVAHRDARTSRRTLRTAALRE